MHPNIQKKPIRKHIGILCAMPEEIGSTLDNLENIETTTYGDLKIYSGNWRFPENSSKSFALNLSIAWSGWGKVSSARAATRLISHKFRNSNIEIIFFTGVAGAIDHKLKQWDIVLPNQLIQYDMDARPLFKKYEIPALNNERINSDYKISKWAFDTLQNKIKDGTLEVFGNLHEGLVATGDKFINDKVDVKNITDYISEVLAVEMEGAAVAQVAKQEKIPFQIIRVISDEANESSPDDFNNFILKYNYHSSKLISILIENIEHLPI